VRFCSGWVKKARRADGARKINRFLHVSGGWHARCTTDEIVSGDAFVATGGVLPNRHRNPHGRRENVCGSLAGGTDAVSAF
jgi:hypothetical protein